jgi:carboxylesterase type B
MLVIDSASITKGVSVIFLCVNQFPQFHPINPEFRPVVDGHVITDLPSKLFKAGHFQRVPFMIGTVEDEFGECYLDTMVSVTWTAR